MNKMGNSKTVYRTILRPLLIVVLVEIVLMTGSYWILGINDQLDKNARDILIQQTENRRSYLQNEMIQKWSNLSTISQTINERTQQLIDQDVISLQTLDSSSKASAPLLNEISKELISTLYSKEATGIFVILNTHDLRENKDNKPGIYIRNNDPSTFSVKEYGDLLLEKAPVEVVRSLNISTDTHWESTFDLSTEENTLLYKPFEKAYHDKIKMEAKEYGYWNEKSYHLKNDDNSAISYSMPLILPDGTVYGVVGVELLTSYLENLMPIDELKNDNQGSYVLSVETNDQHNSLVVSSASVKRKQLKKFYLTEDNDKNNFVFLNGKEYYAAVQNLNIYNSNGPFSKHQWQLVSLVERNQLYTFSNHIFYLQISMIVLVGIVSLIGIFYVSRKISGPISRLSKEVDNSRLVKEIPELHATGIQEIDQFSSAITALSQEVLETSTKFLNIMNMASIDIGGYEIKKGSENVYVTDNFFLLLGIDKVTLPLSYEQFEELFKEVERDYQVEIENENERIYCIKKYVGLRYVRLKMRKEADREIGIAEDITTNYLERQRIERDFDVLTGLYNRFSFQRHMDYLFEHSEQLKIAALVMIDLDNLKKINDAFGHDWGDNYIHQCGKCFQENVPEKTICARVSGDEFYLFLYGYDSQEEIRQRLISMTSIMQHRTVLLPNGNKMNLSASIGISWYPQNSVYFDFLKKYADFAMYQVKKSTKGNLAEFDKALYEDEKLNRQMRLEFHQLIEKEQLTYHFQPILSAKNGEIIAYEALMRSQLATLKNPEMILKIAREENKLEDVERICIFKSTETFDQLRKNKLVKEDALLFINSIASVSLNDEDRTRFHHCFSHIQSQIVVEVTEEENMSEEALVRKRETEGFSGMFALDDYGSGYNTEINLLNLNPKYIKIDLTIVRDIDKDFDKQQLVSNIVEYAHQREAYIIAEGIETKEELLKVLELGVDYLQGYYLSYPQSNPQEVFDESIQTIKNYWKKR